MAYCAVSDVQAEFKATTFLAAAANPTSLVTSETVTTMIGEADALINSFISGRYSTPVTATASLPLLSLYSRTLVAERVRGILANKQQTNQSGNQSVRSEGFSVKDVMQCLRDIKNGDMNLPGADLILPSAGFYSNNNANGECAKMKKDCKQW
jgi:phage gp36-like protein